VPELFILVRTPALLHADPPGWLVYSSTMSDRDAAEPEVAQQDTERTFDRLVDEGQQRLGRSWSGVIATGVLGGLDVGVGVLALLLVEHETGSKLLGGLGFSIGFIALTLAGSELFTEDFLVPVAAVVTKTSTLLSLLRLWGVTIVTNLAGGWLITGIIIAGFPSLRSSAVEAAMFYIDLGSTWRAFALALFGGFIITLMTHMQHSTDSDGVRLVPAVAMGFLLGAGQVNHAIVGSLLCFAALQAGAPFGYADWLGLFAFAALGNMIGGLGLVTVLSLLQVPHKIAAERRDHSAESV
jgi:formate/nitrite transporter FocA (FNT family)